MFIRGIMRKREVKCGVSFVVSCVGRKLACTTRANVSLSYVWPAYVLLGRLQITIEPIYSYYRQIRTSIATSSTLCVR